MTQTLNEREDPLNLGGGWASSTPLRTWSSCHRRRRGAPIYKRRHRYGPKAEYEPPRKQPKQQHGPGPWFQPPRRPYWAVYSNWGRWGMPWRPPPVGFRKPPGWVQVIWVSGLQPLCFCCCSCQRGPWNPGWARPPGRKKRWGSRGRGLRRPPRRPFPKSPPGDINKPLQPVNPAEWPAPGMRAPPNTTQFIMNQIYEDMRQQEKLKRQQAQEGGLGSPAASSGNDLPPNRDEEDMEVQETSYSYAQNPLLVFSPDPNEENKSPILQLVEEEEEKKDEEEECDKEEEEDEEAEGEDEEEVEEADSVEEGEEKEEEEEEIEEEEEGLEEDEQREEENYLPLKMPLSFLVGAEEERENFITCPYLSPEQIIPEMPQEALFMVQDINC